MSNDPKIIIALDYPDSSSALVMADRLAPERCRVKVGKELFVRGGPQLVESLMGKGFEVFLDLKFHDIPNTVAAACRAAADLGVWMVNVHASGGPVMMTAARDAVANYENRPLLIAVTVLTSMGQEDLTAIGMQGGVEASVERLASLTNDCGLDGVVCSAREAYRLRQMIGNDFNLVTPGIRPTWAATGDQKRITTPSDAVRDGANYLVIGRPVTAADDPIAALEKIEAELAQLA